MKNSNEIIKKMKKISEIAGNKAVFRIGADLKRRKFDLLSIDFCAPEEEREIIEIPDTPDYIG